MRWWAKEEWVESGLRGASLALRDTFEIDPAKTTWRLLKDDRGARVAIVFLRK